MPRVYEKTKSTAGKPYSCGKCSSNIEPKTKYYEWSFRYGGTHRRHVACGRPRQSELTQSKMSSVYAAVESVEDAVEAAQKDNEISSLAEALRDAATSVEEVRDEYQSSLDGMFSQEGSVAQEMQEKIDALDSFADTLNSAADDVENFASSREELEQPGDEPEEPTGDHEAPCPKVDGDAEDCTCGVDEKQTEYEEAHTEWETTQAEYESEFDSLFEEAISATESALGELSI